MTRASGAGGASPAPPLGPSATPRAAAPDAAAPAPHAPAHPVLHLDRITKRFGAHTANDAISLTLRAGEVVALLGENGAGKTTLMNILFGHYTADDGTVTAFGRALPPGDTGAALAAGIGMVHQHVTLAGNLTVAENITLGTAPLLSFGRPDRAAIAALAARYGLAVDPDARVARLSAGERQRVEILKALWRRARVLILDEPTAVLTPQEATALFATLRAATAEGLAVIFISHKLHEVMAVADRCVVLRHGKVTGEVAVADTSPARLAAMMMGGTAPEPRHAPGTPGPVLLRLDRVSAPGLHDLTMDLRAGQITGLAGVSGNGQRELAALLGGLAAPTAGRLEIAGRAPARWTPRAALDAGVGRIPEDRHATGAIPDFPLSETAALEGYARPPLARGPWRDRRAVAAHADALIAAYDIRCQGPGQRTRLLSGGNMQKLILGRVLEAGPKIIVAHQPVQGLDVGAIAWVHGRLVAARDAGAAVLLISDDLDEILSLADEVRVISRGRLSPAFPRGTMTQTELGLWMAGQGFDHAA